MSVIARPDLGGALIADLRAVPEIFALTSTPGGWTDVRAEARVSGQRQSKWNLPCHAIWLHATGGPPGNVGLNQWYQRFDVTCYGSTVYEAKRLMNIVVPVLCPDQSQPFNHIRNGVRIRNVVPEAEMIADVDPLTTWPTAWLPMVFWYDGRPA
jgi:hypothetical protein